MATGEGDASERIIGVIRAATEGATNEDLNKALPDVPSAERMQLLNKLLKEGAIQVFKKGQTLIYRVKDVTASIPSNVESEEQVVHQIIAESGNKGIWIRDIRVKANLNMTQLNKILKNLETKKIIKAVKSVSASKKKVYMLYNLEPDTSVTGGAWYQDQDFESEFVDVLNQQCLRYLQMKREKAIKRREDPYATVQLSYCTTEEVHKYIMDLGISKVKLEVNDMDTILRTVVYDGNAESVLLTDGKCLYRAVNSAFDAPGFVATPCGICPVINQCANIGDVTPLKCEYLRDWLDPS